MTLELDKYDSDGDKGDPPTLGGELCLQDTDSKMTFRVPLVFKLETM